MPRWLACILFSATLAAAQERSPEYRPSPVESQLGRQLLEESLAQALAVDSAEGRAFLLLDIGRAYSATDKAKAREVLLHTLAAAKEIPSDDRTAQNSRSRIQVAALQSLEGVGVDIGALVDEVSEPRVRAHLFTRLIDVAIAKEQHQRAIALFDDAETTGHFPYQSLEALLSSLPRQFNGDAVTLFSRALAIYKQQNSESVNDAFSILLQRHWQSLPRRAVLESVEAILDHARKKDEGSAITISVSSGAAVASFEGNYEYQLFQMLPILKQLDPSLARRLLEERRRLAGILDTYPDGFGSFDPGYSDPAKPLVPMSPFVAPAGNSASAAAEEQRRTLKLFEDAQRNPRAALAAALAIRDRDSRFYVLIGLAQRIYDRDLTVARGALREAERALPHVREFPASRPRVEVIRLYLRLKDEDGAKEAIAAGMKAARAEYDREREGQRSNAAPRILWHSTYYWREMLLLAAQIAPGYALQLLKEIPDEEIQTSTRTALASFWVGAGRLPGTILVRDRNFKVIQEFRE